MMETDEFVDDDVALCPDEDDTWDDWEDDVINDVTCFFCDQTFTKAGLALKHCWSDHGFDLRQFCPDIDDQISYIRLVNFVRSKKPKPCDFVVGASPWLNSDEFLRPVDAEDPMLQYDLEDLELDLPRTTGNGSGDSHFENVELVSRLKEAECRAEQAEKRLANILEDFDKMKLVAQNFMMSGYQGPSTSIQALSREEDEGYAQPYGHYSIHQEMLQDRIRTSSYGDFILQNSHVFKDKIVLDIGCGTGILSLFAAKAGAKKVFAVDQSDIYIQAKDIVNENGYDDVISVYHGKLEDIELPVEDVDIIVSEWMGYFLLFESMLDTIIFAREKWLKSDGVVYPDVFTISLVGCGDPKLHENNVEYWSDVYGFKMNCMRDLVVREAAVEVVKSEQLITNSVVVKNIDANTVSLEDVDFRSEFKFHATKNGSMSAIVGYFDTIFSRNAEKEVKFSTGPGSEPTHWKQTVFLVEPPLEVVVGQSIDGSIICKKNPKDPRSLKVSMTLDGRTQKYVVE